MRPATFVPLRARPALLLGLALLLYLPMLGARDIVTSHEARVAQTARQMAQTWPWQGATLDVPEVAFKDVGNGVMRLAPVGAGRTVRVNPWLVPVLNHEIRLQKPPLPYWCAAVLFRLFGFGEGWARLAPALLGATSVLLIYDLARMLMGRTAAWIAGLVWLSTYFPLDEHRKAMADPYLAFFTLVCVWAWVRRSSRIENRGLRIAKDAAPHDRASVLHPPSSIFVFYFSLALGVLAKGPMIFLHVGVVLVLFHFCYRRRMPGRIASHALGVAILLLVALPWYAYVLLTVPDALKLASYESLGELTADNMENARQWWFYAPNLLVISLPWVIPWAMGLAMPLVVSGDHHRKAVGEAHPTTLTLARRRRWRNAFAPIWLVIMVLFFSALQQKKNAYLLPEMPAWTLATTQGLLIVIASARRGKFRGSSALVPMIQAVAGIVFAGVLIWFICSPSGQSRGWHSTSRWTGLLLAVAALALASAAAFIRNERTWFVRQTIAYGALMALYLGFVIAPQDSDRSAKPIAREVNGLLRRGGYTLLTDRLPPEAAVYLPLDVRYEPSAHVLAIADDSRGVKIRRKQNAPFVPPKPEAFRTWVDDGRVIDVQLLPVPGITGDSRWKLYDLTIDRRAIVSGHQHLALTADASIPRLKFEPAAIAP